MLPMAHLFFNTLQALTVLEQPACERVPQIVKHVPQSRVNQ
jgi:hypothetical protein